MLLYRYGGIYERGSKEYTMDDFYSLQLDKMDAYVCLKESSVVIVDGDGESSSEDDDDSDDSGEEEDADGELSSGKIPESEAECSRGEVASEELPVDRSVTPDSLRAQAVEFMGASKSTSRPSEDAMSTPLPGETLAVYYARSRESPLI
jgi:hypothetical protein